MANYISFPFTTDPELLYENAVAYLQSKQPGWVPDGISLDNILLRAFSFTASDINDTATNVSDTIFRALGPLVGVNPLNASMATADTTWTARDNAGYLIPAGTQVKIAAPSGEQLGFETVVDVTIPAGSTTAVAPIRALEEGSASSGLGAASVAIDLVDVLDFITSVTLVGETTGGQDAEADSDYLARLTTEMQLIAPRPILPNDFALLARNVTGVYRATALDGYNPASGGSFGNERMIALALTDDAGNAAGSGIKTEVQTMLDAMREVNFVVNVIDPTYTTIDVNFSVKGYDNTDAADIEARTEQAVANFLSPLAWGVPISGDPRAWVNDSVVRINEIVSVLAKVDGVHYVTAVTQRVSPAAFAATDINLTGAAPLTRAGVMTATVL